MCEQNVPPVGAAMLNYVALEDEDWTDQQKAEIEEWQAQHGHKPEGEPPWTTSCECFKHFVNLTNEHVSKGHARVEPREVPGPGCEGTLVEGTQDQVADGR